MSNAGELNKSAGLWALGCPFSEDAVHREARTEALLSENRKGFLFLFVCLFVFLWEGSFLVLEGKIATFLEHL